MTNRTEPLEENIAENRYWLGKSSGDAFCLRALLIAVIAPTLDACDSTHCWISALTVPSSFLLVGPTSSF